MQAAIAPSRSSSARSTCSGSAFSGAAERGPLDGCDELSRTSCTRTGSQGHLRVQVSQGGSFEALVGWRQFGNGVEAARERPHVIDADMKNAAGLIAIKIGVFTANFSAGSLRSC